MTFSWIYDHTILFIVTVNVLWGDQSDVHCTRDMTDPHCR